MSLASLEEVAVFDDEGSIVGLQFDGRERRIQEWRENKEEKEYQLLFKRLRQRNSTAAYRARHPQKCLEASRRWWIRKFVSRKLTCDQCGKTWWTQYGDRSQPEQRFCKLKCRERWHIAERQRKFVRTRVKKSDARDAVIKHLAEHPNQTAEQIAEHTEYKLTSLRVWLKTWVESCELKKQAKYPIVYSIGKQNEAHPHTDG